MSVTNSFADLLVRLRKEAGLSRSQLSEGSGLSYPYISQLETGQRMPSRKATWALARPLSIDPAVLEAAVPADESDPQSLRRAAAGSLLPSAALSLSIPSAEGQADSGPTDIIGDVLDLLDELDPDERLEALAEIQKLTMQRIVEGATRKRHR